MWSIVKYHLELKPTWGAWMPACSAHWYWY